MLNVPHTSYACIEKLSPPKNFELLPRHIEQLLLWHTTLRLNTWAYQFTEARLVCDYINPSQAVQRYIQVNT